MEDRVSAEEAVDDHEVDGFADAVRVDVLEHLVPGVEHLGELVVDLLVVADLVRDHARVRQDALVVVSHVLNPTEHRVSLQVVKLIHVQTVRLIRDNVKHPS